MVDSADSIAGQVGQYKIIRSLARGATSEVIETLDTVNNRPVALKLFSRDFLKEPDAASRFRRESAALTELSHPNIACIYEAGVAPDGRPFFAMEFVNGPSLRSLIEDRVEVTLLTQLDLMIQAAEGLGAALNRNIIHRDVKPANLMVEGLPADGDGKREAGGERREAGKLRVKIVDFGLAKIMREDADQSAVRKLIGTPKYMAPEVTLGRPADYRSDIYSLGATFYHLMSGRPPFDGPTAAAIMRQHVNSPLTPLHLLDPTMPSDVCEIFERAMAKDPCQRYQDYDELLSDLKAARMALVSRASLASDQSVVAATRGESQQPPASYMSYGSYRPYRSDRISAADQSTVCREKRSRAWLVAAAIILAAAALLVAYQKVARTRSESQAGPRGLIQSLVRWLGKAESPRQPAVSQEQTTLARIDLVRSAIRRFRGTT
ncbi:serine/threonine protein kinase, partial [Candidatus Sumerlaeota bacterium]|nr:serine/threonine protein kinase [Candidatus Sumerlaeota bacterium]